jgi:hypothetical protein
MGSTTSSRIFHLNGDKRNSLFGLYVVHSMYVSVAKAHKPSICYALVAVPELLSLL